MAQNENDRAGQDRNRDELQAARKRPAVAPQTNDPDIEAMNTDGKGTGGMGADLGGYGPVPGSDSTG